MKPKIKRWRLRPTATGLFLATLLLAIILNPVLTYANKTIQREYTIFHNQQLDSLIRVRLDEADQLIKASEFYNPHLQLDICLNDGSNYPKLIKALRGQAFAWGFYNKVVLQGTINCQENYVELNGYKWNLTQLLAHEVTHCLQFEKLGLLKSRPLAGIPDWKWEGYAEYVARQQATQKSLVKNLNRLQQADRTAWEIILEDNTISPRNYYQYRTLVQYCLDVKGLTYEQLLQDKTTEDAILSEMMNWYKTVTEQRTAK